MLAVIVDISWLTTAPITTIHQHIRHIIPLHQRSPYSKPLRPLRGAKLPVPLPHQPTWTCSKTPKGQLSFRCGHLKSQLYQSSSNNHSPSGFLVKFDCNWLHILSCCDVASWCATRQCALRLRFSKMAPIVSPCPAVLQTSHRCFHEGP